MNTDRDQGERDAHCQAIGLSEAEENAATLLRSAPPRPLSDLHQAGRDRRDRCTPAASFMSISFRYSFQPVGMGAPRRARRIIPSASSLGVYVSPSINRCRVARLSAVATPIGADQRNQERPEQKRSGHSHERVSRDKPG
jgi:hypothetical protein